MISAATQDQLLHCYLLATARGMVATANALSSSLSFDERACTLSVSTGHRVLYTESASKRGDRRLRFVHTRVKRTEKHESNYN